MQRQASNAPRPYSTLRDSRVVWVSPDEARPAGPVKRSRLETDAEVRARVMRERPWWTAEEVRRHSGDRLDKMLTNLGLPKRQVVDNV